MTEHGNEAYFSRYGKTFQEKIFQCFLNDRDWAAQMVEIMNPTFFDVNYLQYLSERFFAYYTKYKCFPTMGLLITIIKDDLSQKDDAILRDQIVTYLHRIKTNPHLTDLDYVKDKTQNQKQK